MPSLVIILDDRATNRRIYAQLVSRISPNTLVQTFASPTEALARCVDDVPDLVITDFRMPEMDGAEFILRLRAMDGGADVPVIAITAYNDRDFRLAALEAGATDFLQSPVDPEEFVTRARNLVQLAGHQKLVKLRAAELQHELNEAERCCQDAVRGSRERLVQVIDTIPAMISAVDTEGRIIFANAYHAEVTGTQAPYVPQPLSTIDRLVLATGEPHPGSEEDVVDSEGRNRVFRTSKFPMRDGVSPVASVLTVSVDVSESKQAESHLRHLAHYDALTDLPNRTLLQNRLEEELARTRRSGNGFALHFLDLDRFKSINDAFGHHVGDELLKAVADRLRALLRGSDVAVRLGGDEFAILQPGSDRAEEAAHLADRVIQALSMPFIAEERQVCTGVSIGITLCPQDGDCAAELLKSADLAMYRAKMSGRNQYHFFTPEMQVRARAAVMLELDLRQALSRGELILHYQPQANLRTKRIVGVEALVRWRHPERGLLRPADFLSVAEESGLIVPITNWVLNEACLEAARWQHMGLSHRIAVNLSSVLFRKEDVHKLVADVLSRTRLDPALLELELTETVLMENQQAAAAVLRELQAIGVRFSIDDFGTGYSSLGYLKLLPVNRLKIDKSFVQSLATERSDIAIVRAILSIGRSLDLDVIAEGVETEQQVSLLRAEGCWDIQGHYFSPPLPAPELRELLRLHHPVRITQLA